MIDVNMTGEMSNFRFKWK